MAEEKATEHQIINGVNIDNLASLNLTGGYDPRMQEHYGSQNYDRFYRDAMHAQSSGYCADLSMGYKPITNDEIPKFKNLKNNIHSFEKHKNNNNNSVIPQLPTYEITGDKCYHSLCECNGYIKDPSKWNKTDTCKNCLHGKYEHSPLKPDVAKENIKQKNYNNIDAKQLPKYRSTGDRCHYFNCQCKSFVDNPSKWSKDKCKTCNHHKNKHSPLKPDV
eukprot:377274_1